MEPSTPPVTPQQWKRVMKQDGEEVLILSIRRPAFPDTGKTKRMERYFAEVTQQWKTRWETQLFPAACQALADAREISKPFVPWKAELDFTVTLWRPPLLSLYFDTVETGPNPRPIQIRMGETWDCERGYPRTLRSFFPAKAHHWRKDLLDSIRKQAAQRLATGESLLDPDCAQVMERSFDPDRF